MRTTDEGRRFATKLTGPTSAAWNSVSADQSGSASAPSRIARSARPSSILRRSSCQATDAALSSKPTTRTQSVAGSPRASPTRRAPVGLSSSSGHRPGGRGVQPVERRAERLDVGHRDPDERRGLGARADLQGQLRDDAERAQRAGQEPGEVVAGDVLDDPAAPLDERAVGRDEADAEDLVARPPGAEPPGAAGVGREDRRPGWRGRAAGRRSGAAGSCSARTARSAASVMPGLDGDRHVGGRVVDDPVERPGVDRDAGVAGGAAVIERGAAPLRVDARAPAATRSTTAWRSASTVSGRSVAEADRPSPSRPPDRGFGPGQRRSSGGGSSRG